MSKILLAILITVCLSQSTVSSAQTKVYVIEITDEIDLGLVPYVERVATEAAANNAMLVLHINTFGGRVDAATQIKDVLLNVKTTTVAFIDKRAISAGALIALSCRKIVMTEGGTIGAATPIYGTGEKASEKVVSFMRSEMRSLAERNHRRTDIAEAMVDEDLVLKDTLLLDKPKGKLLTLTTDEAVKVGFCDTTANSFDAMIDAMGWHGAEIVHTEVSISEHMVRLFTSPVMSGLLILIGLAGIFYTFKTGHLGIVAGIAILAFILFFGAAYIAKLATVIIVLMFIAGLFMLLIEIGTPIPTFGIAGIIGLVLMVGSLFFALVGDTTTGNTTRALWTLSSSLFGFIVAVALMVKFLPSTPWWRKFILTHEEKQSKGYVSTQSLERFVGQEGEALTILRPAGIAIIGGERVDVVADGSFIAQGTKVRVKEVVGARVVVEKC